MFEVKAWGDDDQRSEAWGHGTTGPTCQRLCPTVSGVTLGKELGTCMEGSHSLPFKHFLYSFSKSKT